MSGDTKQTSVSRRDGSTSQPSDRFRTIARHVLGIEGGHSNDPVDRGGETKHGVSLRFLVAEGKIDLNRDGFADFDLDMDGDIDGADIRLLTPAHAIDLFDRCFWTRFRLDRLPAPLDGAVFDQAVNGGGVAAVKMLQRALNRLLPEFPPIAVDGRLGPVTHNRVATALRTTGVGVRALLSIYRSEAANRYRQICNADTSQRKYLNGWLKRAAALGNV